MAVFCGRDGKGHVMDKAYAVIRYMSDLMDWDYESLIKLRNCGKGTADEIIKKAAEYGIVIKKRK